MYTSKVFPSIPNLPQDVIEAAALLAMNDTKALRKCGWKRIGTGAYSTAWSNHEYVIKTAIRRHAFVADVESFAKEYYTRNVGIKNALRTARQFLVPTEWLFDCVAVQEVVPVLGIELIGRDDDDRIGSIIYEDMEEYLGMSDVHEFNWGIGHDGSFRIFDPMCLGQAWYPESAKQAIKSVMKKLA